eukprot:6767689-Alexandrium_andersonii.AAC.1
MAGPSLGGEVPPANGPSLWAFLQKSPHLHHPKGGDAPDGSSTCGDTQIKNSRRERPSLGKQLPTECDQR